VHDVAFAPGDWLVFGSETAGLAPELLEAWRPAQRLRLPMRAGQRSLNLSNAVAVTVFEAWRQQGFGALPDLRTRRHKQYSVSPAVFERRRTVLHLRSNRPDQGRPGNPDSFLLRPLRAGTFCCERFEYGST
jgi:hypothetical protein